MEGERREFVIPPEGIERLDVWLTSQCEGFSRARVQGLMKAGLVTVNGTAATRSTTRTAPGDLVTMEIPPPVPAEPEPEDIPLSVIFEDDDVTGVNEVRSQKEDVRSEWFDLQGRKVAQPTKGLYIVNGKKVVLK